jgi:hypothetical protein
MNHEEIGMIRRYNDAGLEMCNENKSPDRKATLKLKSSLKSKHGGSQFQ